jgi:hypothetical protein
MCQDAISECEDQAVTSMEKVVTAPLAAMVEQW